MGYRISVIVLIAAVSVALIIFSCDKEDKNIVPLQLNMAQGQNLSAFLLGGTGAVGKEIIKALAESSQFTRVTLIGRRQVTLPTPNEDPRYNKFDEKIIDFDNLQEYEDAFKGYDVGFSSLGTTRSKSGAQGFYKVDHDYVVNTAKLAKAGGCRHLHLVSSTGANKDAYFLYPKTKGEVEEEIKGMGFPRLSIYRPALLLTQTPREETRVGEAIARGIIGPLDRCRWWSVDVPLLGKVIVANSFTKAEKDVEILDNKMINVMGKSIPK